MKREDVIKTLEYAKVAKMFGETTGVTNAWLHGIFELLYGIAEALDVFEDDNSDDED